MKRKLRMYLLTVIVIYLLVCVAMFVLQRKLLYMPSAFDAYDQRVAEDLRAERVELQTADGHQIYAWWMPGPLTRAPFPGMGKVVEQALPALPSQPAPADSLVWLSLGGNAAGFASCGSLGSVLLTHGQQMLRLAYRGYSGSQGSPSEAGLIADARAAWDWLRAQGIADSNIVIVGKSLGGGVATALTDALIADGATPAALVLETTFTSVAERAQQLYWWLPVRLLVLDSFDSETRLRRVAGKLPIAILGATRDQVVPFAMSERLRAIAGDDCYFVSAPLSHNEQMLASGTLLENLLGWLGARRRAGP